MTRALPNPKFTMIRPRPVPMRRNPTAWRIGFECIRNGKRDCDEVTVIASTCAQDGDTHFTADGVRYTVEGFILAIQRDNDWYRELCSRGRVPRLGPPDGWAQGVEA